MSNQKIAVIFENDRMHKWFSYSHLPERLQPISKIFYDAAAEVCDRIPIIGAERTVALRKLLEAKDCAVRAMIEMES